MSDAGTAELHRAYLASGSTSDLVALLSARLRDGSLSRERVELAAYLGHEAARQALGGSWLVPWPMAGPNYDPDMPTGPERFQLRDERADRVDVTSWARGLARYGREASVRCALSACTAAIDSTPCGAGDVWHDGTACCPVHGQSRQAMVATERMVVSPDWANRVDAERLFRAGARSLPLYALRALSMTCTEADDWHMDRRLVECFVSASEAAGPEAIRSAVLRDVALWALGLSDPLREANAWRLPCSCPAPWVSLRDPPHLVERRLVRGRDGIDREHCAACGGLTSGPSYPPGAARPDP